MEKAYDRAWRYGILRDLHAMGFRGNLPFYPFFYQELQNFSIKTRTFNVRIGNVLSRDFLQTEGVPQGSVLSVLLFIIKINGLLEQLPQYVTGSLFVDDLQISCASVNMAFIERQLQKAVGAITKWADNNGFIFSSQKTSCVHFCKLRGLHPDPEILLYGQSIPVVSEQRFLGILFDSNFLLNHIF
ncbi:putative RNA-directed DNA polymerase from transposon X-element [Caerostris extrusa]|uniref:RNA-directed DNA polymerase from transposon X-element n=1 Tax=Caerostris extrusa TaxID=172846 RepID=A0AAV4WX98_CAEEX|nr:putative RNA-directed DNA polymerase from transposon X-element [Caerostris extrusa]